MSGRNKLPNPVHRSDPAQDDLNQKKTGELPPEKSRAGIPRQTVGGNDSGDRPRETIRRAIGIRDAMRNLILSKRDFTPDDDTLNHITKVLAPEDYERAVEMDRVEATAPPDAKFMELLRATGRDIQWWAVNIVSQLAMDNLMEKPPSNLRELAHRSGTTEEELGTLMNSATADSVALLAISLPAEMLRELQISITPVISETASAMLQEMRFAAKKLQSRG